MPLTRSASAALARALGVSTLLLLVTAHGAAAWGCEGHEAIARLAERLLDARTRAAVTALLRSSPIDPALARYCGRATDPMVDASTWADDVRKERPGTAAWHFIDVPRRVEAASVDYRQYCPGGGCLVDAIVRQFAVVRSGAAAPARAEALRFLIHLVADAHQPLHTTTNGDRGGNCLPVWYYGHAPKEGPFATAHPNLHTIWDSSAIRGIMRRQHLQTADALASFLDDAGHPSAGRTTPTTAVVLGWVIASHQVARDVAYGDLPVPVPFEDAPRLRSCEQNDRVGRRLDALHEVVAQRYEASARPAIEQQLAAAAIHLAETLRAAFDAP